MSKKKSKQERKDNKDDREVEEAFKKLRERERAHQEEYQPKEKKQ